MKITLSDWAKNSWIKTHTTSKKEIEGLFSIVEREIRDSELNGISSDGNFHMLIGHRLLWPLYFYMRQDICQTKGSPITSERLLQFLKFLETKRRMMRIIFKTAVQLEMRQNMIQRMKHLKEAQKNWLFLPRILINEFEPGSRIRNFEIP